MSWLIIAFDVVNRILSLLTVGYPGKFFVINPYGVEQWLNIYGLLVVVIRLVKILGMTEFMIDDL